MKLKQYFKQKHIFRKDSKQAEKAPSAEKVDPSRPDDSKEQPRRSSRKHSSEANNKFEYEALPDPNTWIRLLEIQEGPSESTIVCRLKTVSLVEAPEYAAISYTWGTKPSKEHPAVEIFVDGKRKSVWENCYEVLSQIRQNLTHILGLGLNHIWIDSVSINQEDLTEKASQVQIMASDIFPKATWVFACLGRESDNSDVLIQRLTEREQQGQTFSPYIGPDRKLFNACCAFANRPYWKRIWILPELLTARRLQIFCGAGVLHWRLLENMLTRPFPEGERAQTGALGQDIELKHLQLWSSALHRVYQTVQKIGKRISSGQLERLLINHSDWKCGDSRDRMYAFWSMTEWPPGIIRPRVDYEISRLQLAQNVLHLTRAQRQAEDLGSISRYMESLMRVFEVPYSGLPLYRCIGNKHRLPEYRRELKSPSHPAEAALYTMKHTRIFVDVSRCQLVTICEDRSGKMTVATEKSGLLPGVSEFPEQPPKEIACRPLFSGPSILGWVCPDATFGDILLEFRGMTSRLHLVLRLIPQRGQEAENGAPLFNVVGQATIDSGFNIVDNVDRRSWPKGVYHYLGIDTTALVDLVAPSFIDLAMFRSYSNRRFDERVAQRYRHNEFHDLRPAIVWPSTEGQAITYLSSSRRTGLGKVMEDE